MGGSAEEERVYKDNDSENVGDYGPEGKWSDLALFSIDCFVDSLEGDITGYNVLPIFEADITIEDRNSSAVIWGRYVHHVGQTNTLVDSVGIQVELGACKIQ